LNWPQLQWNIPGAILPKIQYVDANGAAQTLEFRYPPVNVNPMAPVPKGSDNIASDGTLWTVSWYVEAYMEFETYVLMGDDMDAWLRFLSIAVNGQTLTIYPNKDDITVSAPCTLMVAGRVNSSGAPAIDPRPTRVSPGLYKIQAVLRFQKPSDASLVFDTLNGRSEAADFA